MSIQTPNWKILPVVVTNTIPQDEKAKNCSKLSVSDNNTCIWMEIIGDIITNILGHWSSKLYLSGNQVVTGPINNIFGVGGTERISNMS